MAAQHIDVFTIRFPDPDSIDYHNNQFDTLPDNVSFRYPIANNIQTLSAKNSNGGNDPYGILFVPQLRSDGCKQSELKHVPGNATRLHNLPQGTDYSLVALAPWFSPTCMHEYLESARGSPVQALLVYQPGRSAAMPPAASDASWALGDGGAWKSANNFPTYAIMPVSGSILVEQLGLYSGNVTDAPKGSALASMLNPTDYVRLWAGIRTESDNKLPSLWVLVVIVLALLIFVLLATSTSMHIIQRRRREDLRQRIINGELNLETVGVKRLTVPREFLEKLSVYTYTGPDVSTREKLMPTVPIQARTAQRTIVDPKSGARATSPVRRPSLQHLDAEVAQHFPAFSQPTCPICLDDFEPGETQVRELPCRHIYHPECIDPFLLRTSSLCPMCKESVLPRGYCPTRITNVMVRRERILRRMRNRAGDGEPQSRRPSHGIAFRPFESLGRRLGATGTSRAPSALERRRNSAPDIEMAATNALPPSATGAIQEPHQENVTTASVSAPGNPACRVSPFRPLNRHERAQERAMALLGDRHVPNTDEDEEPDSPRWKRGLRKLFPGFR